MRLARATARLAALLPLAALAGAQEGGRVVSVDHPPVHLGTIDPDTMEIEPGPPPAAADAPVLDYDNGATNGFTFLPGPGKGVVDWGVYAPSGPGTLHEVVVGYATHSPGPISLTLGLHAGTLGHCGPGEPGTLLAAIPLSGLPGSPDGSTTVAHTLAIATELLCLEVPAGPIGWEYRFFDVASGPLLVDGPLGLPAPNGTEDLFDAHDLAAGGCASASFGGCLPPFLPCASFYLQLVADDGSTPWSATPYGSGVNPPGSLVHVGGTSRIGDTLVLGVTNPLGTQPVGSSAFLAVATQPDPAFPGGTPIPGFGMSAPGATGELLISLVPPNPLAPVLGPSVWAGPAFPSTFPLAVPCNASLIGVHVFAQGLIADFAAGAPIPFGLSNGMEVVIGF